jgi:hypothetical protein
VLENLTLEAQGRRALVSFVPQLLILTKCSGSLAPEVLAVLQRLALEASGKQALVGFEADVQVGGVVHTEGGAREALAAASGPQCRAL